jgi:hypothetical protein
MANTIYRSDISQDEIKIIVNFSYGVRKMARDPGRKFGTVLFLGKFEMLLPTWFKAGMGWQLSCQRVFTREAVGIERHSMHRLAKYLGIRTADLVKLLVKCSMLSGDPVKDDCYLHNYSGSTFESDKVESGYGYIVEMRRAMHGFSQSDGCIQAKASGGTK